MNFMDYSFLVILLLSGLAGMYQGLVRTVVGMLSMFFTFFISIFYYPLIAHALKENTPIYDMLKKSLYGTMNNNIQGIQGLDKLTQLNDNVFNTLIGKIYIPPALKNFILDKTTIDLGHFNTAQLLETLSTRAADIFINLMGFIILFAFIQFIFTLLQNALSAFFTLPILSELNVLGGFAVGVLQGVITLFVICAAWSMLAGYPMYHEVFVDLNASKYAKWFYDNNLLLQALVHFKLL